MKKLIAIAFLTLISFAYSGEIIHYSVTPTLSTSAYASGDVLFDTVVCQTGVRHGDVVGVTIVDKDDQGEGCDLYFFSANVPLGTANSLPTITDANAEKIQGVVSGITASKDLGGVRVGTYEFTLGFDVQDTGIFYVAAITNSTATHTASGITLTFRVRRSSP